MKELSKIKIKFVDYKNPETALPIAKFGTFRPIASNAINNL
jgi:hypothetical protein